MGITNKDFQFLNYEIHEDAIGTHDMDNSHFIHSYIEDELYHFLERHPKCTPIGICTKCDIWLNPREMEEVGMCLLVYEDENFNRRFVHFNRFMYGYGKYLDVPECGLCIHHTWDSNKKRCSCEECASKLFKNGCARYEKKENK